MALALKRLAYRIAYPLAAAWWLLSGAQQRGAKCLLTNDDQLLLVRHTYGDRRRWDLPGGFVRRGEEPADAARREMDEELGVELRGLRPLGRIETRVWGRSADVQYFSAELPGRALTLDAAELAESGWFDFDRLPDGAGRHVREAIRLHRATR